MPRADLTSPDPAELLPLLLPFLPWGPVVDGAKRGTLGRPLDEIRAGRFNDVPVVMGSVQDEGTIFLPEMPFIAGVLCKDRRPLAQRGVRPEARISNLHGGNPHGAP